MQVSIAKAQLQPVPAGVIAVSRAGRASISVTMALVVAAVPLFVTVVL